MVIDVGDPLKPPALIVIERGKRGSPASVIDH